MEATRKRNGVAEEEDGEEEEEEEKWEKVLCTGRGGWSGRRGGEEDGSVWYQYRKRKEARGCSCW